MKALLTLICVFTTVLCFSQVRQNVYFYKNNGKQVKERDSADYTRVIREPDSGSKFFKVLEYYINSKPKRMGESSTIDPITLEGQCITYYKSGSRKEVLNYKRGQLINEQYYYYPNGKLGEVRSYPDSLNRNKPAFNQTYLVTTFNDTTGTALITNGNGHHKLYNSDFSKVTAEGDVKDGLKNGEWKISVGKNDSLLVNETYNKGKLVSGTAKLASSETYTYTQPESMPEFKGGITAFYRFLGKTLRYPSEAFTHNIQGRVNVSFIVEKDGSLTSVKVFGDSPAQVLSDEAIRVVKLSPNWNPGIKYGRPVRVTYTVPVVFTLGR
jgi:TonB family protein